MRICQISNQDIETLGNKFEAVKKAKKEANKEQLTPKKKKNFQKRKKNIKVCAKNSGKTNKICDLNSSVHVSNRFQRTQFKRCYNSARARTI